MIRLRTGVAGRVLEERPGAVELEVEVEGRTDRALAYPALVGPVGPGDRVLLNTTAVALGLGTGGLHFVIAVLPERDTDIDDQGHTMKLRYTPSQLKVLGVEERDSPHRSAMETASSVDGTPVVWAQLHSMVGPIAAGARAAGASRVAFVMTDGAALPAGLSRLLARLRRVDLLCAVVTSGQAFGGDLEAVNTFTGLLAAKVVAGADVVVVGDGPGNTGTDSVWGATDIESAMSLNAAAILGGRPVAALRISFADRRERHQVVSHHAITALSRVALQPVHVAVPSLDDDEQRAAVWSALRAAGLEARHQLVEANGQPAIDLLRRHEIEPESMGRRFDDDPAFFLAGGAAGVLAGRMAAGDRAWRIGRGDPP
jgi:hypothetical protein